MSGNPKRFRLVTDPMEMRAWGGTASIQVGGIEINRAVRAVRYSIEAGDLPRVTLDLVLTETEIDGDAVVSVPDTTRAALVALGWTPPPDQP